MEYRAFHLQALSYTEARQVVEMTKLLLMDWLEANTACTWWMCSCILKIMMVCSWESLQHRVHMGTQLYLMGSTLSLCHKKTKVRLQGVAYWLLHPSPLLCG